MVDVSDMTELTALTGNEALYVVENMDSTPVPRRISSTNLATGLAGLGGGGSGVGDKLYLAANYR